MHYDFVIVGSGFGGSVSALRLSEKGYRVAVIEKGRRFAPDDFPTRNWQLRRFFWLPMLWLRGPFKMTFFRHVTVLSGVGVGGGSLVYANTLPVPKRDFFNGGSWHGVAAWEEELAPHYLTAKRMLGATRYQRHTKPDEVLAAIAKDLGRAEHFHPTDVAVFFGEEGQEGEEVDDPYFDGEGPRRSGCTHCGQCMTGCRHGAKNTLDKNYLYLAEGLGAQVFAETTVTAVRPRPEGGYQIEARPTFGKGSVSYSADRVVLAGGVLGTVDLLLQMKDDPHGLPGLSRHVGGFVRTNSESLIGVTTRRRDVDLSAGVAITSILHTDDHSHVEPVRFGAGSGLYRLLMMPHAPGSSAFARIARAIGVALRRPGLTLSSYLVPDWAKFTTILLYMRSLEGTLAFRRGRWGMRSTLANSAPPTASIPEATDIAERFGDKIDGLPGSLFSEVLLDIPTTAHILGGACIGPDIHGGVINAEHEVYGYPGLYVCDGSAISANPGVNPSLTITAMTERAMSFIVPAEAQG